MAKNKYLSIGTVMKRKADPAKPDEKGFYLRLEQPKDRNTGKIFGEQLFPITLANGIVLKDGDILSMYSKKESLQRLVDNKKMDQAKADELAEFLLFDVSVVVKNDDLEPTFDKTEIKF